MGLSKFEECVLDTVVEPSEQQHRFSLSYKIRKRKIIKDYEKSFVSIEKTRHFRLKYLLIAVISAGIAVLAGFGVYSMIEGFRVTDYDTHSLLYIVDDYETGKTRIEKKFCIDLDMSDYEVETVCDEDIGYWLSYKKGDILLSVNQEPLSLARGIRLNTENAILEPQQISINGWKGLYFQPQHGGLQLLFHLRQPESGTASDLPLAGSPHGAHARPSSASPWRSGSHGEE